MRDRSAILVRSNRLAKGATVKRLIPAVAAATLGLLPATASATPKIKATPQTAHIVLDSYHAWNRHYTPPVSTPFKVPRHEYYVATTDGTFSYYAAVNYVHPKRPWKIVCGTPEPSAKYPGAGGDGPVGFDSEFVFARPWKTKRCVRGNLPAHWRNFQMDNGSGWTHPALLGTAPTSPRSDHTYSYAVVGDSAKIRFRLLDRYVRDNYGALKITVRPATATDCASYSSFGFTSQAACVSAVTGV